MKRVVCRKKSFPNDFLTRRRKGAEKKLFRLELQNGAPLRQVITRKMHVIIPARFASTRLPGKPLADIAGKSLIQRVYERAKESGAAMVVVATDDERIRTAAESFGAQVCMTRTEHRSGTERLAEVIEKLQIETDE